MIQAFQATAHVMVEAIYQAALAHGEDNGARGERPYHPGYQAIAPRSCSNCARSSRHPDRRRTSVSLKNFTAFCRTITYMPTETSAPWAMPGMGGQVSQRGGALAGIIPVTRISLHLARCWQSRTSERIQRTSAASARRGGAPRWHRHSSGGRVRVEGRTRHGQGAADRCGGRAGTRRAHRQWRPRVAGRVCILTNCLDRKCARGRSAHADCVGALRGGEGGIRTRGRLFLVASTRRASRADLLLIRARASPCARMEGGVGHDSNVAQGDWSIASRVQADQSTLMRTTYLRLTGFPLNNAGLYLREYRQSRTAASRFGRCFTTRHFVSAPALVSVHSATIVPETPAARACRVRSKVDPLRSLGAVIPCV